LRFRKDRQIVGPYPYLIFIFGLRQRNLDLRYDRRRSENIFPPVIDLRQDKEIFQRGIVFSPAGPAIFILASRATSGVARLEGWTM
jgi:hypothetical protein